MNKEILPIVVLYKKHLHEAESINALLDSDTTFLINDIYVYDNSPGGQKSPVLENGCYRGRHVIYIKDPTNPGVSKAYNSGLEKASELGYKYVLILDQDTYFPPDSLGIYKDSIENRPDINLHVPSLITKKGEFCSPLKYAMHRGFVIGQLDSGVYSLNTYSPINSGMLLNAEVALRCGGYNKDVYLDFSDFQFIERLKKISSDFYLMPLSLQQDLSNEDENHNNILVRYAIYCDCARKCYREKLSDHFIYFMMVLVRGLKLTFRTKKISFLNVFYKKYVRGKK